MNLGKLTLPLVAILFIPIFFIFIPTNEWAAVLLICFSFLLLFTSRYIRRDGRLLLFAVFVLAVRHGVSIVNAYFTIIFGADLDATTFHLKATEIARSTHPAWFAEFGSVDVGSALYVRGLGFCYRYFGESLLLGQTLSILAYVIAGILLIRMADNLGLSKWKKIVVLLYGGLPPAIIYESITMREAWEALFFLSVCYHTLQLRKRIAAWRIGAITVCGICLGFLHNGLLPFFLSAIACFGGYDLI
jgi:hypothetical protein